MKSEPKPSIEVVNYNVSKTDFRSVSNYDACRYIGPANEYKRRVTSNAYKRLVGPLAGKRILDVGCGTGRGVLDFAGSASLTIGTDASLDMLTYARSKIDPRARAAFVRSYAQQLPFPDASFDVVTALNFLHLFSLATQAAMIAEMKRVVRPGGILVLEFDNALNGLVVGPYKRWSGRERGSLPHEIRGVIGNGCHITHVFGAVFPIVWRVFYHFPRIFIPLEKLAYIAPINQLSHRVFYRLVRLD